MGQQTALTAWWKKQIGTAEAPYGSNHIRYVTEYLGYTPKDPWPPYCMMAQWVGFKECGLSDKFMDGGKTASCTRLYEWAVEHGQWVTGDYCEGDVFIFAKPLTKAGIEHTGYYTGCRNGSRYITIEANNTSAVGYVNREASEIFGAYRAKWDDAATTAPEYLKIPEIKRGDKGAAVVSMQILLDVYGFDVGPDGADGDFGANTEAAVKRFQATVGLKADGICGEQTWPALINYGGEY